MQGSSPKQCEDYQQNHKRILIPISNHQLVAAAWHDTVENVWRVWRNVIIIYWCIWCGKVEMARKEFARNWIDWDSLVASQLQWSTFIVGAPQPPKYKASKERCFHNVPLAMWQNKKCMATKSADWNTAHDFVLPCGVPVSKKSRKEVPTNIRRHITLLGKCTMNIVQ